MPPCCVRSILGCLALTPEAVNDPQPEEALLARGLGVYRPYLMNEEPVFAQDRLREAIGDAAVDAVSPPSPDLLERLFRAHVRTRLEPEIAARPDEGKGISYRKRLLRRHGGGCLGYTTLKETVPLYLAGGKGYVSVRTKGRTAVMIADPVCPEDSLDLAVRTFLDHACRHGLAPAAVQIGRVTADALTAHRGCATKMGDEALVDLRLLRRAPRGEGLRAPAGAAKRRPSKRNHRSRAGARHQPRHRARRGLPRLAVTQGEQARARAHPARTPRQARARHADLPGVARRRGGRLRDFDPIHRHGTVAGWNANHERYAPSPRGIHDLILLEAIRVLKAEKIPTLSLGLAPLARLDVEQHPTASPVVRTLLGRTLTEAMTVYNFEGVAQHKTYYRPRWRPVYFWAPEAGVADRIFDVFALIGLVAPEALRLLSPETMESFTRAAE